MVEKLLKYSYRKIQGIKKEKKCLSKNETIIISLCLEPSLLLK